MNSNIHFTEIAALAESIAEENIFRGKVDLERIAKKKMIKIIKGIYGDSFLGELVHHSGRFYIYLNKEMLDVNEIGRTRFTIAHELGHFFIDDHRNILRDGISLSHKADYSLASKNPLERQANHFASNLLLPRERVLKTTTKFEAGLSSILGLKNIFDTSILCTAFNYIGLDIFPCILIKWENDLSFSYASYSSSFAKITGVTGKPAIQINKEYLSDICKQLESETPKPDFIENATFLSKWLATVAVGSKKEMTGLEQTMKLGNYGGITFLTFFQ